MEPVQQPLLMAPPKIGGTSWKPTAWAWLKCWYATQCWQKALICQWRRPLCWLAQSRGQMLAYMHRWWAAACVFIPAKPLAKWLTVSAYPICLSVQQQPWSAKTFQLQNPKKSLRKNYRKSKTRLKCWKEMKSPILGLKIRRRWTLWRLEKAIPHMM